MFASLPKSFLFLFNFLFSSSESYQFQKDEWNIFSVSGQVSERWGGWRGKGRPCGAGGRGPYRDLPEPVCPLRPAPLPCVPGSHFLWSWISLDLMYFSLVPLLLSFIPSHFSLSPPTPSRSRPPKLAVQSLVSILPCPVHHVHQLLLSPFLQCSLSKVPRHLWFLNQEDSSFHHSFHKY